MQELQKVLADFFAERIRKRTAKLWQDRGYTNETMNEWLNDEKQ